jgi:hypothetical protein
MSRPTGKKAVRCYGQGPRKRRTNNPNSPRLVLDPATGELSQIRATRRTGHAVAIVTRAGRCRRYTVSLRRYAALREWTVTRGIGRASGYWLTHGMCAYLWGVR